MKPLQSPLDCTEIQLVHSEGDQPWDFFGRNDAKAETPVLWPPLAKSWFIGKTLMLGGIGGRGEGDDRQWYISVQFSRSVVSDCLRPHESQHARPPCPSPTPGVHSDSHPSSQWCHPAISSSVVPFSSSSVLILVHMQPLLIHPQYHLSVPLSCLRQ